MTHSIDSYYENYVPPEDREPAAPCGQSAFAGYNLTLAEMSDLKFVLQFALDVIENADLGNTMNSSNWILDQSIEEQIGMIEEKL